MTRADPSHLPDRSNVEEILNRSSTLTDSWLRQWASDGSRPTIQDHESGWLTASMLEEESRLVAEMYLSHGLTSGDRIAICANSSTRAVVAYVAALRAGLVVVPINVNYRQNEVTHIVRDANLAGAVVDDAQKASWIESASKRAVTTWHVDSRAPAQTGAPALPKLEAHDPALLIYTSGTTGSPKGAVLTHRNLSVGAETLRLAWRWGPEDRLFHTLPLFHLHGLGVGINGSLSAGASIVLRPKFNSVAVLNAPRDFSATLFFGVPTMFERLANHNELALLGDYRLCVSGSAPLSSSLFHTIAEHGRTDILERYGMTETMLTVSNPYDGVRRAGTVGFPLPGVSLRLNSHAEIELRGSTIFNGYWKRPHESAMTFTDDGWFKTGDLGSLDSDGYLRITGRLKDLIITGGYNVYPREVEESLLSHPGVMEVAVKGVPSDRWGEEVTAWVVGDEALTESELLSFLGERLAPYKSPKSVKFLSALPRNSMGKVVKHELG
jgi:malonyl-CoA/methylmalonyl-CoA synthetase